jgi:arylsulfatase A-like enzyme
MMPKGTKRIIGNFAAWIVPIATSSLFLLAVGTAQQSSRKDAAPSQPHNVILFVTDGLRHDSVTIDDAPTIYRLRSEGVDFVNSHSLFPTVTTANASALATGHQLGDTGNFANSLFDAGADAEKASSCGAQERKLVFDMENNLDLALLNCLHSKGRDKGVYLGVPYTLISLARNKGYNTAVVGKLGPAAIQDISEVLLNENWSPGTAIVDGQIGQSGGLPIPAWLKERMSSGHLDPPAPKASERESKTPNVEQQDYFTDVVAGAILPEFAKDFFEHKKTFFLIFWSADPDRTQHYQPDSLGKLELGINGPTSKLAIHNADQNLREMLKVLKALKLLDHTDIIVAADHGFSTVSKGALDASGSSQMKSYAAGLLNAPETGKNFLPSGFLALDLAHSLHAEAHLYDLHLDAGGHKRVGPSAYLEGGALIGTDDSGKTDGEIITVPSGNSELIYLPRIDRDKDNKNNPLALQICDFLTQQEYVDGVFVRHDLGQIAGTLPLRDIGLDEGSAKLPEPAIVVNFKGFALDPHNPWGTWVQIADTMLKQGQGQHGGLNRADTFNNIAAKGPDFKHNYTDSVPVSNADVAQTIAHILGLKPDMERLKPQESKWEGRVLYEALKPEVGGDADAPECTYEVKCSNPTNKGFRTILEFQTVNDKYRYLDEACFDKDQAKCRYFNSVNHGSCKPMETSCTLVKTEASPKAGKLREVVAGGQTGVDQAGLRAAKRTGLETGGWCPPGCKSLDGDVPSRFGLRQTPDERSAKAPDIPRSLRTEWNVRDSDGTLVFSFDVDPESLDRGCTEKAQDLSRFQNKDPGTVFTISCATKHTPRPLLVCDPEKADPSRISKWITDHSIETLNVAGPAEQTSAGIGRQAEDLLFQVFNSLHKQ